MGVGIHVGRFFPTLHGIADVNILAAVLGAEFPVEHLVAVFLFRQNPVLSGFVDGFCFHGLEAVALRQRNPELGRAGDFGQGGAVAEFKLVGRGHHAH